MQFLILINYNAPELIELWLENIRDAKSTINVILVNNSPEKDEFLKNLDDVFYYIEDAHNNGYASAVNSGFRVVDQSEAVVAVVNPDISPNATALQEMMELVGDDEIISPQVANSFTGEIEIAPMFGNFYSEIINRILRRRLNYNLSTNYQSFSGSCWVCKKSTFNKIGVMYNQGFLYGEEREYSYRAKLLGVSVKIISGIRFVHKTSYSVTKSITKAKKENLRFKNMLDFYERQTLSPSTKLIIQITRFLFLK